MQLHAADQPARPGRAAFVFIFITVVLDMLALGIVVPVLPRLVKAFEGGDTALAADAFGVFGTAWAVMQFLFSPLLGALSDRFGRRPVVCSRISASGSTTSSWRWRRRSAGCSSAA